MQYHCGPLVVSLKITVLSALCLFVCDSMCVRLGEACWWTIHPASKQRSEGEKVRVGDDLILVSVSSERYLVCASLLDAMRERERDIYLSSYSMPGVSSF